MAHLDHTVDLKIQDIVEKLQKLECTLLGNKDDAWIMELLFSPGLHRYQLIEWILSKLGCDAGKMPGPQNSSEERLGNLQSTVSDLGICRQNIHNIIKGTAPVEEQLEFWCTIVDVISLKHKITSKNTSVAESDEGIALSPEKRKCIDEEFEHSFSVVKDICKTVDIKQLFEPNVQLLAPDVEREIKNISPPKSETQKIPTLQDIRNIIKQLTPDPLEQYSKLQINTIPIDKNENGAISDAELNESEEKFCDVSVNLKNSMQQKFSHTYEDLEPLILQACKAECSNVGEYFENLESVFEELSQLERSIPSLESSDLTLSEITSDLHGLKMQDALADPVFMSILKMINEEL